METIGVELPDKPGYFSIDRRQLSLFMPHRYPMVLLDEVAEVCVATKTLIGVKRLRPEDPYVIAHSVSAPFMLASFVVESLAQAAGCLMNLLFYHERGMLLAEIETAEFLNLDQPPVNVLAESKIKQVDLALAGESLHMHVAVSLQRKEIVAFRTEAKVADRLIAHGDILLAYPPYMPKIKPELAPSESLHATR
jgi:3-hydroxymyristoyl/3-hydroxydecanoyl-(acyl carrier protein) dehydratase